MKTLYVAHKFAHQEVVHSRHLRSPHSTTVYGDALPVIRRYRLFATAYPFWKKRMRSSAWGWMGNMPNPWSKSRSTRRKEPAPSYNLPSRRTQPGQVADEWLRPEPGAETSLIEIWRRARLADRQANQQRSLRSKVQRSAQLLLESSRPVILLGAEFLSTRPSSLCSQPWSA